MELQAFHICPSSKQLDNKVLVLVLKWLVLVLKKKSKEFQACLLITAIWVAE